MGRPALLSCRVGRGQLSPFVGGCFSGWSHYSGWLEAAQSFYFVYLFTRARLSVGQTVGPDSRSLLAANCRGTVMKTKSRLSMALVVCCAVAAGLAAQPAPAQVAIGAGVLPYAGYWGYWPFRFVDDRPLPYYAAHPPVYYSGRITARPYGAVPFAYLPGVAYPHNGYSPYRASHRTSAAISAGVTASRRSRVQRIYPARKVRGATGPQKHKVTPGGRPAGGGQGGAAKGSAGAAWMPEPLDGKVLRVSNPFVRPNAQEMQLQVGSRTVERVQNPFFAMQASPAGRPAARALSEQPASSLTLR